MKLILVIRSRQLKFLVDVIRKEGSEKLTRTTRNVNNRDKTKQRIISLICVCKLLAGMTSGDIENQILLRSRKERKL